MLVPEPYPRGLGTGKQAYARVSEFCDSLSIFSIVFNSVGDHFNKYYFNIGTDMLIIM